MHYRRQEEGLTKFVHHHQAVMVLSTVFYVKQLVVTILHIQIVKNVQVTLIIAYLPLIPLPKVNPYLRVTPYFKVIIFQQTVELSKICHQIREPPVEIATAT